MINPISQTASAAATYQAQAVQTPKPPAKPKAQTQQPDTAHLSARAQGHADPDHDGD